MSIVAVTIAAVASPAARNPAIAIATSVAFVSFTALCTSDRVLFEADRVLFVAARVLLMSERYGVTACSRAGTAGTLLAALFGSRCGGSIRI